MTLSIHIRVFICIYKKERGWKVFFNCLYSQDVANIMSMMPILNNFQNICPLIWLFEVRIFLRKFSWSKRINFYILHTHIFEYIDTHIHEANSSPKDKTKQELILIIRSYYYQIQPAQLSKEITTWSLRSDYFCMFLCDRMISSSQNVLWEKGNKFI